jgi:hypothetical protein
MMISERVCMMDSRMDGWGSIELLYESSGVEYA